MVWYFHQCFTIILFSFLFPKLNVIWYTWYLPDSDRNLFQLIFNLREEEKDKFWHLVWLSFRCMNCRGNERDWRRKTMMNHWVLWNLSEKLPLWVTTDPELVWLPAGEVYEISHDSLSQRVCQWKKKKVLPMSFPKFAPQMLLQKEGTLLTGAFCVGWFVLDHLAVFKDYFWFSVQGLLWWYTGDPELNSSACKATCLPVILFVQPKLEIFHGYNFFLPAMRILSCHIVSRLPPEFCLCIWI